MTGERGGHCGTDRGGTRGRGEQKGAGSFATSDVANQVAAVGRDQSLTSERRGSRRAWLWEPPCLPFLSLKTFFFLSLFLRLGRSREGLYIFRHKKKKKPAEFPFRKSRYGALRASAPTRADSPDGCGAVVRPLLVWSLSRHRRNKNPSGVGRVT